MSRQSATRFDANTDGYSRASALSANSPYRIELWVKPASFSGDDHIVSVNNGSGNGDFDYVGIYTGPNRYYLAINNAFSYSEVTGGTPVTGQWDYLILERESTTSLKLYVNGVLVATNTSSVAGRGTTSGLSIGRFDSSFWLNGAVAEARVYTLIPILSAPGFRQYRTFPTPLHRNLIGMYRFRPGPARVLDMSGRGNHLTAAGTLTDEAGPPLLAPPLRRVYVKAPSGGTVYNDAGEGDAILVASGADAETMPDTGQATAPLTASGADALAADDAGQGTTIATGSGADALSVVEAGQADAILTASGSDALVMAEAGQATAPLVASGTDTLSAAEAGQGTMLASASGADALAVDAAGQATLAAAGSGADALAMADAGDGVLGMVAGGADTFSGSTVYTDAGGGVSVASGSGADVSAYADAGAAVAALFGFGADVAVMVDAGGGVLIAVGSGSDSNPPSPPSLAYLNDAYLYDVAGATGPIAGATIQSGPEQGSPTGSVSGATVQPGPNQSSPTGSVSGGIILPSEANHG